MFKSSLIYLKCCSYFEVVYIRKYFIYLVGTYKRIDLVISRGNQVLKMLNLDNNLGTDDEGNDVLYDDEERKIGMRIEYNIWVRNNIWI